MNSIVFDIVLNILAWSVTIFLLIAGKKVRYECKAGGRYIIPVLFFVCGLISFIRYMDILSLVTFISLTLSGGLYSVIPSGLGEDAIIIRGRQFPYDKIEDVHYEKGDKRINVSFVYRRCTRFLFLDFSQERDFKDIMSRKIKR